MKDFTKNKWISIVLSILVVGGFFGVFWFYSTDKSVEQEVLKTEDVKEVKEDMQKEVKEVAVNSIIKNNTESNNKKNMTTTKDGLQIEDIIVGTGATTKAGDTIAVNYLGTLLDGTKFDSSYDRQQAFVFKLGAGQVIRGWDEGFSGMKVGGKRKLTIPSEMAYGDRGAGNLIPPGATLVFEVELVGIK